jgi:allantoin racemase
MTVLYQIPGDMSAGPLGAAEVARRRDILQGWAAAGTAVDVADSPGGPLSIESHAEEILCVPPMIRALRARNRPADAIIIGCFGDPGLAALRELFDCPVVGPFEASLHLAAQLGARAGVVTVLDSVVSMLDQLARGMGMSLRYAGAAAIDVPVLDLRGNTAHVMERVADAGHGLLVQHGADVLVLGCMSLAFLGAAEQVQAALGVPVVNPAKCALKTAEALVAQDLTASRRTYARPRKPILVSEDT